MGFKKFKILEFFFLQKNVLQGAFLPRKKWIWTPKTYHRVQNCIFMVKFFHVDLSAVPECQFCVYGGDFFRSLFGPSSIMVPRVFLMISLCSTEFEMGFFDFLGLLNYSYPPTGMRCRRRQNQNRHQPKLLSTKARRPSNVFLKFLSPGGRLLTINKSYHLAAVRLRQHRNQNRHQPKLLSTKARHSSDVFLKFLSPRGRLHIWNQSCLFSTVRLRQHSNQCRHQPKTQKNHRTPSVTRRKSCRTRPNHLKTPRNHYWAGTKQGAEKVTPR